VKKVVWGEGKYTAAVRPGSYRTFNEYLAKAEAMQAEQAKANEYLQKAFPAMATLLQIRMENHEPLLVMRPLRYQTSVLKSQLEDDVDRSFYNNHKNPQQDKFVDTVKTINPGTMIVLKGLDPNLQEFIFQDGMGNEHAISYSDRNAILTQTDIFESVQKLFESKGER
jgi:hypothetical protein